MSRWRRSAVVLCAATVAAVGPLVPAQAQAQAVPECLGRPATIVGTEGPDEIRGTPARDVIVSLGGRDVISGLTGYDEVCAGTGNDTVSGRGNFTAFGEAGADTLTIEATEDDFSVVLLYGGAGNDTLRGLAEDTFASFDGGPGDDRLLGSPSDEDFTPGPGDDVVDGGPAGTGRNLVEYRDAAGPVRVSLRQGRATGEGSDTLSNIQDVVGSAYGDILEGDDRDNELRGSGSFPYGAPDVLFGHGGDDVLEGAGTLRGGDGADRLVFPCCGERIFDDTYDGGPGRRDTLDYLGNRNGAVRVDLPAGTATGVGNGNDTLTGVEDVNGTRYADTVIGGPGPNQLRGYNGDDTLVGGGGDDVLDGGVDTDSLDGGPGTDTCRGGEQRTSCEA